MKRKYFFAINLVYNKTILKNTKNELLIFLCFTDFFLPKKHRFSKKNIVFHMRVKVTFLI